MSKRYRLCYVRENILFFTDNFKNQWGDDWDDRPYEHNAEEPYDRKYYSEYDDEWCVKNGKGNIRKIAFDHYDGYYIKQPKDGFCNSPYSVEDINKKAVPWLYNEEAGTLFAGETMAEAKRWLKKAGVLWGELHE
jgi:hypothetical protein